MAGFRLIDSFIPSDGINPQTRKLFVSGATGNIAIGDIVKYTGGFTAENGREIDRATSGSSTLDLAGIVVGQTALDTPLSNQSGLLNGEDGFLIVNTGLDLVYASTVTGTPTNTTDIVGANVPFTVTASTLSPGGIVQSQMEFNIDGVSIVPTIEPFRIEFIDTDSIANATILYGRLMVAEISSITGLTPSA